jgi:hypothetical protein
MKPLVWVLAGLVVLGLLVAAALTSRPSRRGVECASSVMIVRGRTGEPLECLCSEGILTACFTPGL